MSSAVGFGFQADVVNTGSLAHLLTGRVLKALSDGGVDFYAIAAAIALGKGFDVRGSLGKSVRTHIMSRRNVQSIWSKALSIGWGDPGIADAMTKTKAGVNALLLIDAFASGSTSYQAAECFSELLALRGCEADQLPNVDVLKHMIGYFVPFLRDLGFSRVLGHITTTATQAISSICGGYKEVIKNNTETIHNLTAIGDASRVAGVVNQLMLTSERKESFYIPVRYVIYKFHSFIPLPAFAFHYI
ncbi:hypothetical protein F5Y11DRAFT_297225 [Daldinia sp. FL1419]|nr:hypothetical protein F5Y11DRAFT_297225 [Daldinia sp. FL1419]